jgi:hypothetical protein
MSLVEELRGIQESSCEVYYAEIMSELKKQVANNPFDKYYNLRVKDAVKDVIIQRLLDGGLHTSEGAPFFHHTERMVNIGVTIPPKPRVKTSDKV